MRGGTIMTHVFSTQYFDIVVEFEFSPGEDFPISPVTIQPPAPAEIKLLRAWVGESNGRIDILSNLSTSSKQKLKEDCMEYAI